MTTELQIRLLGGLEITQAGTAPTNFMSNKAPALLAYLVVCQQVHQRNALATLLWGEMADADAKNNLRQVLTNLRKVVEPHLLVTRDSIGFNRATSYFLDVEAFEQKMHARRELPSAQQMHLLQQATALYAGDFMAGFFVRDAPEFEEWMLAQRARLRELALHAFHDLTQWQLRCGQYGPAIDSASRSLALDPWREEAHRQLMLALARSGQRSAALAQYKNCQRILQTELGVEPSDETQRLYERIRAAGESIPHNLPPQPTTFVGRQAELAELEALLLKPDCRLLTLVGVGGVGKTRLALQAATQLRQIGAFLNGVYLVALVGLDSPALLPSAIAEAIGLGFTGNQEPKTQLLEFLRRQEVLLVLDNFEHLLDAGPWLSEMLQGAPGVKFLLTSRERLNTRWERLFEVEGLDEASAIALLVDRAQHADPHFGVNRETQPAISRIGHLVQGLPLGLELAAASVRHYSCTEIADSIEWNLDLLTSRLRDVPARHRSIRAVFDHSWQQLTPLAQQGFLTLGIFQGGFSAQAAAAVWRNVRWPGQTQPPHVNALLANLVDKSLLQRSKAGRFQLHGLLRQYAAERLTLQPNLQAAVYQGYGRFYAAFLAQRANAIGGIRQRETLSEIEQELDNLRAAWSWAVVHQPEQELAPFIDGFFEFYEVRSLTQEAVERFGQAVTALQQRKQTQAGVKQLLIKVCNRQARFLSRIGRRAEANTLLAQSSTLAKAEHAKGELALAYNYQGLIQQVNGNYSEAIAFFQASLQLCAEGNDRNGLARAHNNLGVILLRKGDFIEAELNLQSALVLRRQLGNPKLIADSLNNLGILLHERGDYEQEAQLLREALENYRQLDDRRGVGTTLHNLGGVHLALKQFQKAQQFLEEALTLRQADPAGLSMTLNNLGTVALRAGDFSTASTWFSEALRAALACQDVPMLHDILVGCAELFINTDKAAFALELLACVIPQALDSDTRAEAERLLALTGCAAQKTTIQPAAVGGVRTLEQSAVMALQTLVGPYAM